MKVGVCVCVCVRWESFENMHRRRKISFHYSFSLSSMQLRKIDFGNGEKYLVVTI